MPNKKISTKKPKELQKTKNICTRRERLHKHRNNSLDVRPQARDQSNEVPTNEARNELSRRKSPSWRPIEQGTQMKLGVGCSNTPNPQKYDCYTLAKCSTSNMKKINLFN